ncbi:glycosyltransferase [Flavobacterium sp. SUN052]|uniref:glycosyltransferase n=1 Tax=Flavobacterium sp. SUN052 TaxID=3002441 RepID=UPI00237D7044|nr:glycosyltransferase [Flavobacterium sp. SUN052]MEC4004388.1 glycosyltransferase [Flavobacterium sp. SUN052]
MTFCIITHVVHKQFNEDYFAYSPYVNEMNIWLKKVDKVVIVAPLEKRITNTIDKEYSHLDIEFIKVPHFSLIGIKNLFYSLIVLPQICFSIAKAMQKSDHIHLRLPGNMGLLGCIIQVFFPKKRKTAKYAGNWDPNSKQPFTYKLQKWIVSSTFLTKNMQVLVYGEWPNQSKNIKPFFTATYCESEKEVVKEKSLNELIKFIFVGTLSSGKRPLYAIQLVESLKQNGFDVQLDLYGEGVEFNALNEYIEINKLDDFIFLKGNRTKNEMKELYTKSHFLLLASKSEGWPKVVAEAMFWGCLPLVTAVSCVPNMLENENRGLILEINLKRDIEKIKNIISNTAEYQTKIKNGINWSRNYTIDKFEAEISKLI